MQDRDGRNYGNCVKCEIIILHKSVKKLRIVIVNREINFLSGSLFLNFIYKKYEYSRNSVQQC